jgi:HSP20 family molecular chaperone IbpA
MKDKIELLAAEQKQQQEEALKRFQEELRKQPEVSDEEFMAEFEVSDEQYEIGLVLPGFSTKGSVKE